MTHIRKIDANVQIDNEILFKASTHSTFGVRNVCVCVYVCRRLMLHSMKKKNKKSHLKFTFQHIELFQQTNGAFEHHTAFGSTFEHFVRSLRDVVENSIHFLSSLHRVHFFS